MAAFSTHRAVADVADSMDTVENCPRQLGMRRALSEVCAHFRLLLGAMVEAARGPGALPRPWQHQRLTALLLRVPEGCRQSFQQGGRASCRQLLELPSCSGSCWEPGDPGRGLRDGCRRSHACEIAAIDRHGPLFAMDCEIHQL